MNKDIKLIIKRLKKHNWVITIRKNHYKAKHPKGGMVVFSVTPSCPRAINNIEADIRRVNNGHRQSKIIQ